MDKITLTPIGIIYTPFATREVAPRGPSSSGGAQGRIIVDPTYAPGLKDLDGFSHLIIVFHLNQSDETPLLVTPRISGIERGVFATHSPDRPNHIGISILRLDKIEGNILHVRDVDMLDGTPLLDIKPYSPPGNIGDGIRQGWIDEIDGEREA